MDDIKPGQNKLHQLLLSPLTTMIDRYYQILHRTIWTLANVSQLSE